MARPPCTPSRYFASSSLLLKKAKPTPSSKPAKGKARAAEPSDESTVDLEDVLEKTKGKMIKAVEWAKGVLYDGVERGRGRVSPGERLL
jgi:ribosome recycling factor